MNEWSSYLPDGRAIHVARSAEGWRVFCDDADAKSRSLHGAMRAAVGLTDPERPSAPEDDRALSRWVDEHAARIEREAD